MRDDIALLRAFVDDRSDAAFSELVNRHINVVYAAALRRVSGDAHRAEDVTQLVFSTLARKAATVLRHPSLLGWLHTCTRLAAADLVRREERRRARELCASAEESLQVENSSEPNWERLRPFIDEALDELSASDRDAILMRFFGGSCWADVGKHFRVSEDTARKRVDYALERLRRQLARRGVHSSASALTVGLAPAVAVSAPTGLATSVAQTALLHGAGVSMAADLSLFMSTGKFNSGIGVLAFAALSVIGTGSLAIVAWNGHAESLAREAQFTAEIRRGEHRNAELTATIFQARREATATPSNNAPAPKPEQITPALAAQIAILEAYAANPEYMALMRRQNLLRVQEEFGEFFVTHALSREKTERLKQILAERWERSFFLTLEYAKRGPRPGDQVFVNDGGGTSIQAGPDAGDAAIAARIKELLGDTMYHAFERFDDLKRYSRPAQEIAADCRDHQQAMTPAQERQLRELLHRTKTYPGAPEEKPRSADPNPTAEEAALLAEAGAFLSASQTEILLRFLMDRRITAALGSFRVGPQRIPSAAEPH